MKCRIVITLFLVLAAALGCDKTAANKSNLEAGLNHFFARQQYCSNYTAANFPKVVVDNGGKGENAYLDALAAKGLLAKKTEGALPNGQTQIEYDLTSSGKATQFSGDNPILPTPQLFCFGEKRVDEIANFTMPDPNHVVDVTYTWKLVNVPSWAKDPAVQQANSNLARFFQPDPTGRKHKDEAYLRQTNEGWRIGPDN
jgi:hypothetical protein